MSPWGGCPGPQSAWILHPTASLPPAGSRARPAVPSSGATVAPGPPGVFGPECQSTGLMRVSTDLLQSLSLGISGHPSGVVTRPPDNLVGIKHPILRSFTRGTIPGKRTPGGLDKNTRDTFRDIHRAKSHLLLCPKCVNTACWTKLAVRFLREMRRARTRFIASRG